MTISAYIQNKLSKLSFDVDADEIGVLLGGQGVDPAAAASPSNLNAAKHVMWQLIPELLAMPDISQGRFSVKWKVDGIMAYYRLLCDELGLENKLDRQPEVTDRSNLW